MATRRNLVGLGLTALVGTIPLWDGAVAGAGSNRWKGAETAVPVAIGPNERRCGAFPRNIEAHFAGSGIDTFGGPFEVQFSGCLDTEALVLSDIESTDTYLRTGDSIDIVPADAPLELDPVACTVTNIRPQRFDVVGGTGALTAARGGGLYDLAFTLPTCPGPQQAVHVWFDGTIDAGQP